MTNDNFAKSAEAEAMRAYRDTGMPRYVLAVHMAEWARTHLAAQEPTDAEVEAVAVLLYRQRALHHTMESWGREPETVKNLYRLDARAALVTARDVRATRRDEATR